MKALDRRQARRCRTEQGSATLWMVFATIIILAVCGLVFDGGTLISAKSDAINNAEEAARAGAQAVDVGTVLSSGGVGRLDPAEATGRAEAFLARNGWVGTVTADTTSVTVTVTRSQSMTFLQTFGVGSRTITGTATARPQHGFAGP
jgi:Flp pilus assembly protein TadG